MAVHAWDLLRQQIYGERDARGEFVYKSDVLNKSGPSQGSPLTKVKFLLIPRKNKRLKKEEAKSDRKQ